MTKYKSRAVIVDGRRYASKKEAQVCENLKLLERAGKIHSLILQPKFPIWINGIKVFTYIADAKYVENDKLVVIDVKGVRTPMYRLKSRCVKAYYNITITEV